jgi:hypothetical protein
MSKRVTAQEGKIELIVADTTSDIDVGNDAGYTGNVNVGTNLNVDAATGAVTIQTHESLAYAASTPGGTPVTDPNLGSVVFLATAENNTVNATTFAPEIGPTFSAVTNGAGVAEITNSAAKFGTKAIYVEDYTGVNAAYFQADAADANLTFGANDFTIEMHVYIPSIVAFSGTQDFMGIYDAGDLAWGMSIVFQTSGDFRHTLFMSSNGTTSNFISPQKLWSAGAAGTWYHLAVCRDGNNLRHFIDGTQVGVTDDVTGFTMFTPTTAVMYIGDISSDPTTGGPAQTILWDNIRITSGVARYTTNFTAPTAPYDGSATEEVLKVGDTTHARVELANGLPLKLYDTSGADSLTLTHDGTDASLVTVGAADLTVSGSTSVTFSGQTNIDISGAYLDLQEIADPAFGADAGRSKLWVRDDTPNTLVFTDDAGNDVVIGNLTSTINATGTPVDNQIAVWTGPTTLEGDANFTWTGTTLAIAGAGAQLLLPLEDDPLTPTLAFGDGNTGFYESSDNIIRVAQNGANTFQWGTAGFAGSATNAPFMYNRNATATDPVFTILSDSDTGVGSAAADQLSLIAGGVEMLRLVETGTATTDQVIIAPAGIIGDNTTPALAFGDGDSGFYESGDDNIVVSLGTVATWDFNGSFFQGVAGGTPALAAVDSTATVPNILPWKGDTDTGLGQNAADELSLIAGGVEGIRLTEASSSVIQTHEANTGLTADVGSSQGDGVITSTYNVYSTVATAGDAATLPATFAEGTVIYVKNDGAESMDVFPASGDDAGAGLNTAVAVEPDTSVTFIATTADSTWTTLIASASGSSFSTPVRVIGDTDGAAPNNGTGLLEWYDSDESDQLASIGFTASDDFFISGQSSGNIAIRVGTTSVFENQSNNRTIIRSGTGTNEDVYILPEHGTRDGIRVNGATNGGSVDIYHANILTANTNTAANGGFFVNNDLTGGGNERVLTRSDISRGVPFTPYTFDTSTTASDPGTGDFRFNNATISLATEMYIDDLNDYSQLQERLWQHLQAGDVFSIHRAGVNNQHGWFRVTGTPTDNTGWWTIPCTYLYGNAPSASLEQWYIMPHHYSQVTTVGGQTNNTATVQTTDATQTEIISIAVASGTTFGYRINIVGNEAATGDTVFESIFGAIHNQGGTTAIVGSDIVDRTEDAGATAWVVTVAADDTTDALTVDVTGEAAHTIDWKVNVEILDV